MADVRVFPWEPPVARSRWKVRCCILGVLGLAAAILLVPFQGVIWDGGFPSTEYQLRFVDKAGSPVPGVTLQVGTQAGGVCYVYPVDEFVPDQTIASDADGRMVFHHVSDVIEFSGHESVNMLGMGFGGPGPPKYVCVFRLGDREVQRVRFGDLEVQGDLYHIPTVTRTWHYPDWPSRAWSVHKAEWSTYRDSLFDVNGDGQLDREERVAARHFDHVIGDRGNREERFFVVERTIKIAVP